MIRKLVYFFLFIAYLNILTLIPGIRTAQLDALSSTAVSDFAKEDYFDTSDYESLCELFLSDVLQQQDTDYESEDYPVSSHCVSGVFSMPVLEAVAVKRYLFGSNSNPPSHTAKPIFAYAEKSDIHSHYYGYLFRLTPF